MFKKKILITMEQMFLVHGATRHALRVDNNRHKACPPRCYLTQRELSQLLYSRTWGLNIWFKTLKVDGATWPHQRLGPLESPLSLFLKKREGEIEKKKNKGHPPLVCFWKNKSQLSRATLPGFFSILRILGVTMPYYSSNP